MSIADDITAYVSQWDITGDFQTFARYGIGSMFAEVEYFSEDIDGGTTVWTPNGYWESVMENRPIAYWRLGDASGTTAVDTMGDNHPGTYTGTVTLAQPGALGEPGTSTKFDGSTAYVSIPYTAALNTSQFTLEAWIYPTATARGYIFNTAGGFPGFGLEYNAGVLEATLGTASTTTTFSTSALVTENAWNHVAVTYNGAIVSLYVNGTLALSTPFSGYVPNSTTTSRIGSDGSAFFTGYIQEVALYSFALTSAQVLADLQAGPLKGGLIRSTQGQQVGWQPLWDPDLATLKSAPWLAMVMGETLPQGATLSQAISLIKAAPNQSRGTPQSIADAVKQTLTGGQLVAMKERWRSDLNQEDDDAISIATYASQTPSQNAVLGAIRDTVPADIAVYYTALTAPTWAAIETAAGSGSWSTVYSHFGAGSWQTIESGTLPLPGYVIY